VIADLTDKIKDHHLDVKSLEYSSKPTEELVCSIEWACMAFTFVSV